MKLLMLAYYFPPDSSSGAFRPLYFAEHFKSQGDEVTVISARQADFLPEQNLDPSLIPQGINILRTRVFRPREALIALKQRLAKGNAKTETVEASPAPDTAFSTSPGVFTRIKDYITTLLASPDPQMGWLIPAVICGIKQIKTQKPDVIYATGGPWTGLLAGALLKRLCKIPLVLDFRDPWTLNPTFSTRPASLRFLEKKMEKWVISQADLVVANTPELGSAFLENHDLDPSRVVAVPNGYTEESEEASGDPEQPNPIFQLTHAGSLYFSRNPRALVEAVYELACEDELSPADFRLNFVGGISVEDSQLDALLARPEVRELINITPRLPLAEALAYQRAAQVQLLIQTGFPLQVPRKLYDAMPFGRPVLAITESRGATARIIKETSMGLVVDNETQAIKSALKEFMELWRRGELHQFTFQGVDQYHNPALCRKMRRYLAEIVGI